ncbi:MAG: hypothetical protein RIT81_34440 [Deltaproteobacteria bacterium]
MRDAGVRDGGAECIDIVVTEAMELPSPGPGVMLFGGIDRGRNAYGDQWHFDGTMWRLLESGISPGCPLQSTTCPSPRYHTATDGARRLMFGGIAPGATADRVNEVWEYEGNATWTRLDHAGNAPPAMYGAGIAATSATSGFVIAGTPTASGCASTGATIERERR